LISTILSIEYKEAYSEYPYAEKHSVKATA